MLYAWVLLAWLELCLMYRYLENYWHGGRSSQCQICTDKTFENIYTSLGVWLNIQFYHIFHFHMCFSCGSACTFQKTCSDHIGGIYIQSVLDLTFSDRSVDGCACFFPEDFRNMDLVSQPADYLQSTESHRQSLSPLAASQMLLRYYHKVHFNLLWWRS